MLVRTSAFFIANLGSEVARLEAALGAGDIGLVEGALERTRRIFKELRTLPLRASERSEIELLCEVIEDLPKKTRFSVDAESLESYFLPFARKVLSI